MTKKTKTDQLKVEEIDHTNAKSMEKPKREEEMERENLDPSIKTQQETIEVEKDIEVIEARKVREAAIEVKDKVIEVKELAIELAKEPAKESKMTTKSQSPNIILVTEIIN